VQQQKHPLNKQQEIFLELILKNQNITTILDIGFIDEIFKQVGCFKTH